VKKIPKSTGKRRRVRQSTLNQTHANYLTNPGSRELKRNESINSILNNGRRKMQGSAKREAEEKQNQSTLDAPYNRAHFD